MPRARGNPDQKELFKLAIAGIDAQVRELLVKREALEVLAGTTTKVSRSNSVKSNNTSSGATSRKRVFSAATRKRLSLAAKRRWARVRADKKGPKG